MKKYRWRILICVLPVLVSALIVGLAVMKYQRGEGGFKLGVDLAGGTILVYEVQQDTEGKGEVKIDELAAALKKRIDPADLYNVTIRPVGAGRVEIILPTGGQHQSGIEATNWNSFLKQVSEKWPAKDGKEYSVPRNQFNELSALVRKEHPEVKPEEIDQFVKTNTAGAQDHRSLTSEEVEQIKELIGRQGSLEFRILANEHDDAEAIAAARQYFAKAKAEGKDADDQSGRIRNELEERARQGKPPPPPRNAQGGTTFMALDEPHTYSWVALDRDERYSLGLNNDAEVRYAELSEKLNRKEPLTKAENDDLVRVRRWGEAKAGRDKGEPISLTGGTLLYSREYKSGQSSAQEKDRGKKYEYFFLTRENNADDAVTGKYLANANVGVEGVKPTVNFQFDGEGARRFRDLTTKNKPTGDVKRQLAIVLDDQIVAAPGLNSAIPGGQGYIEGISQKRDRESLVRILKAGALPATLKERPVSENTIGATLGSDTIDKGTTAVGLAFVAVLVFMMVYYRFAGLVASLALLANLLLTVAFMVLVHATFTLPGLAGLVLMLGMAVDANVLIYERLREERDRGASLALAIRNGYDRAFPTIIDTHLTSIFTAIVLYVVGNDQLKGFGISLTVGLIISLFTSLYMTRTIFDLALAQGWLKKLSMMRFLTRPNIDFMSIRNAMFLFTLVASVLGIGLFLYRGQRGLDIDFEGGTAYTAALVKPENIQTLRDELGKQTARLKVAEVKEIGPGTFEITYEEPDGKKDAPRIVHVDESRINRGKQPTIEEVKERAQELPDYSLEMIFINSGAGDFGSGDKSRLFTVRTSEKATELVQTAVSRLLGDRLEKITFTYEIADGNADQAKAAVLKFSDFASPARVSVLLGQEMDKDEAMKAQIRQIGVDGQGEETDGRFKEMKVSLAQPINRAKFETALKGLQKQFADSAQPERLENFDSQLATETQSRALYAILASWGAILLYLWFRFGNWTFGLAAVLCLIHDLCFTLGLIAACHYIDIYVHPVAYVLGLQDFKLNLAAIASLLTLVGYSVNDTIVVFDRIREVRGKNPALTPQIINDSVNQTLSRTLLTSFITWLVVLVLYIFGGSGVHLFAFVMVVGVLIGTYSSIYVASPLLLLLGEGKQATQRERTLQQTAGAK